ncbi:aspartate aminotransferase family protein [Desulfobulbus alkaliphilus]|uniref:aspartate aminotransferase family protein n=1 Tax=Desulfobulbus alkaliphilus TaxID=869814 RepID=UPI0019667BF7|nr:aspartate aminotransferase family protein [Desulfobulbus alkaliphilus]MBM9537701.1 aspartate aminotransferase family protein [Desulfobulbus alkaliphilus]
MTNTEWADRGNNMFINTYNRFPAAMVQGSGCRLRDADGREYLDFLAGIAVCSLGHCHPKVTEAICRQAATLVHVSNLFHMPPQIELAELLTTHSFADRVFLTNSGAEANEAAIKLARIHSVPEKFEVISLEGSFHGRTLATVAATGQSRFHEGFDPLPQGFIHAPFGDPHALEALITPQTCAILCEPLQGESGVRPLAPDYLQAIRAICDRHGLLLIFDEVQTGLGRTGTLFAYEQTGVTPDIMTLAKALGNGLPIGAMLTTNRIASSLIAGSHASTFGGNPVCAAAAVATLQVILADGFLPSVQEKSRYFISRLEEVAARYPHLATGVRGQGLLLGLVLTEKGIEQGLSMVERLFAEGVLINFAGNRVLRFIPPLIVETTDIDLLIDKLVLVFDSLT